MSEPSRPPDPVEMRDRLIHRLIQLQFMPGAARTGETWRKGLVIVAAKLRKT
jgi:hypothetical protein